MSQTPPSGPASPFGTPQPPSGAVPQRPTIGAPNLVNSTTVHGVLGRKGMRHPWEIPMVILATLVTLGAYAVWFTLIIVTIVNLVRGEGPTIFTMFETVNENADDTGITGILVQIFLIVMLMPLILWVVRAMMYAQMRASSTRMSPTQFPEGYRMVAEAAREFGLRRVPDAYVASGNGMINAFASGHGFRRFVVVYSDLFEVGGAVRDPEALRFVISHEVGHLAAGHVSYFRLLLTNLFFQVPLLGMALSRSQEYTADNYGYSVTPSGSAGAMAVLVAGKYLNADVNVNELADRAVTEKGLWLHIVNWRASHPILTWRAHALRDRSTAGKLWFRPGFRFWPGSAKAPMFQGPLPAGSVFSGTWPTPDEVIAMLDAADRERPATLVNQFGRFPGVNYSAQPGMRTVQTAAPFLSRRTDVPMSAGAGPVPPQRPMGPDGGGSTGGGAAAAAPPTAPPQP